MSQQQQYEQYQQAQYQNQMAAQMEQQRQAQMMAASWQPDRAYAGTTKEETNAYIMEYGLLAEAAKRAQMACLERDLDGIELGWDDSKFGNKEELVEWCHLHFQS